MTQTAEQAIEEIYPSYWPRLVALLLRQFRDLDVAEEAVQDTFVTALRTWARDGVPSDRFAWLAFAAKRRALDRLRRRESAGRMAARLGESALGPAPEQSASEDDELVLVLACSHPSLSPDAQVALTLRCVVGMAPAEIARAFLLPERTLQQRLVRAKRKIRAAGISLSLPPAERLRERMESALAVTFLIFNEGYTATSAEQLVRVDLTADALHLGELMMQLRPEDPDVLALNALMLLVDSRREARVDEHGDLVPLEEQDHGKWDQERIIRGVSLLDKALRLGPPGRYQLQAAIAAAHATIVPPAEKWLHVVALYGELVRLHPSPIYELNRAVAVAMAYGPEAGLELVGRLEAHPALTDYHLLPATRGDLERRAGRFREAAVSYGRAISLASNPAERRYLQKRLREVESQA